MPALHHIVTSHKASLLSAGGGAGAGLSISGDWVAGLCIAFVTGAWVLGLQIGDVKRAIKDLPCQNGHLCPFQKP